MSSGISVVIPAKNADRVIPRCLSSIAVARRRSPSIPVEVVVVNDHSTDSTVDIARQWGARVVDHDGIAGEKTGLHAHNIGGVRNTGIRSAKYDTIASLDADCAVPDDYVQSVWADTRSHPVVWYPVRPHRSRIGQQIYAAFINGAREPNIAFRRDICPDNMCFRELGWAEIRGLPGHQSAVRGSTVIYTDLGGWREAVGWGALIAAVAIPGGIAIATARSVYSRSRR